MPIAISAVPARKSRQSLQKSLEVIGIVLLLAIIGLALFGHLVVPNDPNGLVARARQPMSGQYWLGTDHLGRDVFSRVIAGARYTVFLAVGATTVALLVGIILGALAGFFGGIIDAVISRIVEVVLVLPRLFLILLLVAFLGQSGWVTVFVIGFTMWPVNARLMRAQVLSIRQRTFVHASQIAGLGNLQIIIRHVIPNSIAPVIASCSLQMADVVLLESGLSYLGLGDLSQISWGRMIQEGQAGFQVAWWSVLFPGVALLLLNLSLHLIGDAVSRRLNVREMD